MKPKIYYNITESDYFFQTSNLRFYFSSFYYYSKFAEKYIKNREEYEYKLSSRFNIKFISDNYFDIILYSNIEKRGFHILCLKNKEVFTCLQNIILSGEIKTLKN